MPTQNPTTSNHVLWQFIRFAVVGVINTAINFIVLNILSAVFHVTKGEKVIWIAVVAFIVATTNSYFMNKHFAFKDKGTADGGKKPTLFLLVSLVGLAINSGTVYLITTYIHPMFGLSEHLWLNVAALGATAISLVWNFIGYKVFVFKTR